MSETAVCPNCGLSMSWEELADEDYAGWYCDGPNDLTSKPGCGNTIQVEGSKKFEPCDNCPRNSGCCMAHGFPY